MNTSLRTVVWVVCVAVVLFSAKGIVSATADFGGETVNIVNWFSLGARFEEGGLYPGRAEEAERLFNVKLEFPSYSYGEYTDHLMARLLAGDSVNDIWAAQHMMFWRLVNQEVFFPIGDILPEAYYQSLPVSSRMSAEAMNYKGTTYGFGQEIADGCVLCFEWVVYNKELFERNNLPDLYQLYRDGEWTWDKMTEIAIKATKDIDGDGETDQWGIGTEVSFAWRLPGGMALSNGAEVTRSDEDGNVVFAFDDEAALETMKQVYEWNVVHNVMGGNTAEFIAGKLAMAHQGTWQLWEIAENMQEDYGIVPLPKGPREDKHRWFNQGISSLVLPRNVKNPEALVELATFLFPPEELLDWREETIPVLARDRNSARVINEAHEQWNGETYTHMWQIGGPFNDAIPQVVNGQKTPAAAMAEIKEQTQAILDEQFNK